MRNAEERAGVKLVNVRPAHLIFLSTVALGTSAAFAFADLHNSDPSEWTGPEVYQILNT